MAHDWELIWDHGTSRLWECRKCQNFFGTMRKSCNREIRHRPVRSVWTDAKLHTSCESTILSDVIDS